MDQWPDLFILQTRREKVTGVPLPRFVGQWGLLAALLVDQTSERKPKKGRVDCGAGQFAITVGDRAAGVGSSWSHSTCSQQAETMLLLGLPSPYSAQEPSLRNTAAMFRVSLPPSLSHCFCAHPSNVLPSSPPPTIVPSTLPVLSHSAFFPTTLLPQKAPSPQRGHQKNS